MQTTYSSTFFNEKLRMLIQIPLKFVPKGPINDKLALDETKAWHRTGVRPLSEAMLAQSSNESMCKSVSSS